MSIRIITDSASDINQNEFENVTVLPMTVTIDGKSYQDGIDMSKDEFYTILENSDSMPISSLISPLQFEDAFKEIENTGDEAIVLTISSGLSGTYQSAILAAKDFSCVSIIDSGQVAGAQRILVMYCINLINQGLSREEVVKQLEIAKSRIVIFAAVDSLKYLLKGGRISKGSAILGGIIGIKPIITLENGTLIAIDKARGSKQSHVFLNKKIAEVGGIDFSMPYVTGYSGTDKKNLLKYIEDNQTLLNGAPHEPEIEQIGSAVGTHAGPGAVLVAFFANK